MPTLGDLAQRLYEKLAATQELLEPKKIRFLPTRWEDLPEWRQEVWVTVAAEAVKIGGEIRQEIEQQDAEKNYAAMRQMVSETFDRMQDRRLLCDPDLQTSLGQMERDEGRVLVVDDPAQIDPDDGEPRCTGYVSAVGRRTNRCFLLPNHAGECL